MSETRERAPGTMLWDRLRVTRKRVTRVFRRLRTPFELNPAEQLLAELRDAAAAGPSVAIDHKKCAVWASEIDTLFFAGRLEAVEQAVRLLLKVSPALPYARSMGAVFDRLPPADGSQTTFTDDAEKDAQVVARPGSDLVIVLFCGRGHRLGLPLSVMHRWLGRLPASLIYLRDFSRRSYLQGVPSLGPDLQSTLAELRRLIATLGGRRVLCYGNSGGVFPALYYGLELGAEAVMCVAGKTNRTPAFNAFSPGEHHTVQLEREYPDAVLDARRLYDQARRPPRVCMVYGQENWSDRRHAEHMGTLACVSLMPIENCPDHKVVLEIVRRGEYQRLLDWLIPPG